MLAYIAFYIHDVTCCVLPMNLTSTPEGMQMSLQLGRSKLNSFESFRNKKANKVFFFYLYKTKNLIRQDIYIIQISSKLKLRFSNKFKYNCKINITTII